MDFPIEVILNVHSGGGNGESTRQILEKLFRQKGQNACISVTSGDELQQLTEQKARGDSSLIVAAGGDGTISSVASVLVGTGKRLGVLPMGTLNHFAKDLGIPMDLENAVATLIAGRTKEVDIAQVNDRFFLNNSSLGIYPKIVSNREAQQKRLGRDKWAAFLLATLQALRRYPFLNLRVKIEEQELSRQTAFLFVGNNEYILAGFNPAARKCLDAGKLCLYVTRSTSRLGLFRLALRALIGRIHQAKDFDAFCVEEAWIETHHQHLLVATDGEVTRMKTPLHYRIRPRALRVQVPLEEKTT